MPAQVNGIWLRREGDDAVVTATDIYGREVELIREHIEGPFSHHISEHGIKQLFDSAYWNSYRPERVTR